MELGVFLNTLFELVELRIEYFYWRVIYLATTFRLVVHVFCLGYCTVSAAEVALNLCKHPPNVQDSLFTNPRL